MVAISSTVAIFFDDSSHVFTAHRQRDASRSSTSAEASKLKQATASAGRCKTITSYFTQSQRHEACAATAAAIIVMPYGRWLPLSHSTH